MSSARSTATVLRGVERYHGFSESDRAAVLAGNANDLLERETPATP